MVSNPSNKVKSELIDEVILRLLGLKPGVEIDYQTYHDIIKKKLAIARLAGKELPREEDELLRNEFKRVRTLKDKGLRFKVKKVKTKVGSTKTSGIPGQKKLPSSGAIVKAQKGKLASTTNVINVSSDLETGSIKKTLDSILSILASKFKFDQKQTDKERREKETEGRGKKESTLEGFKKGIGAIVSTTKKLLSPFQAIIDRIFKFIFFTLLGRAFTSFMDWMSDKGNQKKFDSFIEFLTDHWPALAGLYILFGTSFGKLVRGLMKAAVRMTVALVMNIGRIKAFAKKYKGLVGLGIGVAAFGSGRLAEFLGENKETPESGLIPREGADLKDAKESVDQIKQTPAPRIPAANLGGMIPKLNLGGMIPGFMGGGMDFSQGVPITGAGKDDTLIAARTGEAILTEEDQRDLKQQYGVDIPQYLAGRKPGSVSMSNLRFPGFGGGFNLGGMIPKFNNGGIVGGVMNFFNRPRGLSTRGAQDGFTGMAKQGFDAIMGGDKFRLGKFKPQILGRGAYSAPTLKGAQRYAGATGSLGGTQTPGGVVKTIVPGNARKINFIEPQSVVSPSTFDKGKVLADKLLSGKYSNSPLANRLRSQLMSGAAQRTGMGLGRLLSRGAGLMNAPIIGDMLFPQGTSAYDQLTGPNAYYNAPGYKGPKPMQRMGGGLIKENTGMNIRGATADRQLAAVQPGEYVLPVDTVNRLGVSLINRLVAGTDSNSTPFMKSVNKPQITPYRTFGSGMDGMMTLPPMVASGGGSSRPRAAGLAGSSEVPDFSAVAPSNNRAEYASIYGLKG